MMRSAKVNSRFMRVAAILTALSFGPAAAQDSTKEETLVIELNATQATGDGCAFSFLITNGLSAQIDSMILEAVLFDTAGQVERLTLFDFGSLPSERPRVRQFIVPGRACEAFGSVLINGAQSCEVDGVASDACESELELRSRAGIELIG